MALSMTGLKRAYLVTSNNMGRTVPSAADRTEGLEEPAAT